MRIFIHTPFGQRFSLDVSPDTRIAKITMLLSERLPELSEQYTEERLAADGKTVFKVSTWVLLSSRKCGDGTPQRLDGLSTLAGYGIKENEVLTIGKDPLCDPRHV